MHGGDGGKLLISVLTFAKCVRTHSLNIAGGGSLARVQFHFHRKSRESGEEQRREEEKKKEKKQKKFIIVPGRFQQRRSPADVVRKVPTETKRNERKRRKGNFFELRETGRKTGSFSLAFNQSTIHALYFKSRRGRGWGDGARDKFQRSRRQLSSPRSTMLHFHGRMAAGSNNEDPLYEGSEIQSATTQSLLPLSRCVIFDPRRFIRDISRKRCIERDISFFPQVAGSPKRKERREENLLDRVLAIQSVSPGRHSVDFSHCLTIFSFFLFLSLQLFGFSSCVSCIFFSFLQIPWKKTRGKSSDAKRFYESRKIGLRIQTRNYGTFVAYRVDSVSEKQTKTRAFFMSRSND